MNPKTDIVNNNATYFYSFFAGLIYTKYKLMYMKIFGILSLRCKTFSVDLYALFILFMQNANT